MKLSDEQIEKAEAQFTEWFVKNYPGPDTIIGKPEWHAPRIFSRARAALEAVMPGEPVGECDRERLLLTFFRGMDEDRQHRGFPPGDPNEIYWMQTGEGAGHLQRVVDDYLPGIDALLKAGLVSRHPAPEPGEMERLRAENERLREAHRENIRLLGLVAHDLTGRVEGGKVAAIYTAIRRSEAALAEGESHE